MAEQGMAEPSFVFIMEKLLKLLQSTREISESLSNLTAQFERMELVVQQVTTFVALQNHLQQVNVEWSSYGSSSSEESDTFSPDRSSASTPKESSLVEYLEAESFDKEVLKEADSVNVSVVHVDMDPSAEHRGSDCSDSGPSLGQGRGRNVSLDVPSDNDKHVVGKLGKNEATHFLRAALEYSSGINRSLLSESSHDHEENASASLSPLPDVLEGIASDVLEPELSMSGDSEGSCQDLEQSAVCDQNDTEDDEDNSCNGNCTQCLVDNDLELNYGNISVEAGGSDLEGVCHDLKEVAGNVFHDLKGSECFGSESQVEAVNTEDLGSDDSDSAPESQFQELSVASVGPDPDTTQTNERDQDTSTSSQLLNTSYNAFVDGVRLQDLEELVHENKDGLKVFHETNTKEANLSSHEEMEKSTSLQDCGIHSESSDQNVGEARASAGNDDSSSGSDSSNFAEEINNESNSDTAKKIRRKL